jgi:hypothetical protein
MTGSKRGLLSGARVYLSGPMDFVASRASEQKHGWRNRVGEFLRALGVTVFDPWAKPQVRGLHEYGREGAETADVRKQWTFEPGEEGAQARAACSGRFWETLHIDLRMVDTSDFLVAYCPTNIYSVGTPHEIVVARQQRKPVLLVSPPVTFPAYEDLKKHLADDPTGRVLLERLAGELPIKDNPTGAPSLWYMPLVGPDAFFDGFGFAAYAKSLRWEPIPLDEHERSHPPKRPLLPFLEAVSRELPKRWDNRVKEWVRNDDWLLWDLGGDRGVVEGPVDPGRRRDS